MTRKRCIKRGGLNLGEQPCKQTNANQTDTMTAGGEVPSNGGREDGYEDDDGSSGVVVIVVLLVWKEVEV